VKKLYSKHGDVLTFKFHIPGFPQVAIEELATEVARSQDSSDYHPEARLIMQDDTPIPPLDGRSELLHRLRDQARAVRAFINSHNIERHDDDDRSDELQAADFVAWFNGYQSTTTPTYEQVVSALECVLQQDDKPQSRTRTLTEEQLAALRAFAARHGRNWKSKLNDCWSTGNYDHGHGVSNDEDAELQQIRNTFGPSWLVRFSFTKTSTHRELP